MEFNNYMGKFTTSGEVQTAISNGDLLNPYVALVGGEIDFNSLKGYKETPLTFEITSGGTICWKTQNSGYTVTLEYSKNGGEWTEITSNTGTSAPTITVESGDTVQFRGNNSTLYVLYYTNTFSGTTAGFKLYGNIMSLLSKDGFSTLDTLQSESTFYYLFQNCTGLTDASKLVLPATTLAKRCYYGMFQRCTSLTAAPALPATTLQQQCYSNMFNNCTSLTTAPTLPATTLTTQCYYKMFQGCTNLNYIKCLATDISASNCTYWWVNAVASTGTFVKAAGVSWTTGIDGIPSGWTVTDNV